MLNEFHAGKVYIACGYTDLRRGIDGLAGMVQQQFQLDPFTNTLFCSVADEGIDQGVVLGRKWLSPFVQETGKRQLSVAQKRR